LAYEFGKLADRLIERYPPDDLHLFQSVGDPVAHFLMNVMFCLFANEPTRCRVEGARLKLRRALLKTHMKRETVDGDAP
jgi:hypothetical protein